MTAYHYGQRLRRRGFVIRYRMMAGGVMFVLGLVGVSTTLNVFAGTPIFSPMLSGYNHSQNKGLTAGKAGAGHMSQNAKGTNHSNNMNNPIKSAMAAVRPVAAVTPAQTPTWEQDFTKMPAGALDTKTWHYDLDPSVPGRNNEQEAYTNSTNNVRVEPGTGLIITARKESYTYPGTTNQFAYTSGRIDTRDSFTMTYGRLEADIKLPKGAATWPAFWLLSDNRPYTTPLHPTDAMWNQPRFYLKDGELDIMEHYGTWPGTVEGSAHTFTASHHADVNVSDFGDRFHTYGVVVSPTSITWTLDGTPYGKVTKPSDNPDDWPFQDGNNMYVIFNLAMGGIGGGTIDDNSGPWQMQVKDIRYYSQN